jgi:mono/diheme cytochrome c family protein
MKNRSWPRLWIASASGLLVATAAIRISAAGQADKPPAPTPEQVEFFEANIRPVLIDTCGECHTDNEEGDLRTDSRAALLAGGETGPAIVPGDPEKSLLIHVIRRDEGFPRMPKSKPKLPDATIAAFTEWIKQGAPWPADKASAITAEQGDDVVVLWRKKIRASTPTSRRRSPSPNRS